MDSDDDLDQALVGELADSLSGEDVQLFYQTALIGRRDLYLSPDARSGTEMTLLQDAGLQARRQSGTAGSRPDSQRRERRSPRRKRARRRRGRSPTGASSCRHWA